MEAVTVEILKVSSGAAPPSTRLEYEVRNNGGQTVWLVDDRWLIWSQSGGRVELSFQRGKMRPGVQVFGYFPPAVSALGPGESVTREVELTWPQRLDSIWNDARRAAPPPGRYEVSVRVGYGLTPVPPPAPGEGVEAGVLRWQKEAVSPPAEMTIPAY